MPPPPSQKAVPKPAPVWTPPQYPSGVSAPTPTSGSVVLGSTVTGGFITGGTVSLPSGTTMELTSDLTIVSAGALTIDGTIDPKTGSGANVTLVSLSKNVEINGEVRGGPGADTYDARATGWSPVARGGGGRPGGTVTIIAVMGSVFINPGARVGGGFGGSGGAANATIQPSQWGRFVTKAWLWIRGGTAIAVGGEGGVGGDTRISAVDMITINGLAEGGSGGEGGYATAQAIYTAKAWAIGGRATVGGDVVLRAPAQAQVDLKGNAIGGTTTRGGVARAFNAGPSGFGHGGAAEATGGDGGRGGTVTFEGCVIIGQPPPTAATGGSGGDGNSAEATGGPGASGGTLGTAGGDALPVGGNGGSAGAIPSMPMAGYVTQQGSPGSAGSGGPALAQAGPGGDGGKNGAGGPSGAANAVGGSNGDGTAGQTDLVPAAAGSPPPNGIGGIAPQAAAQGAP